MPGVRHADRVIIGAILLSVPSIREAFSGALSPAAALVRFVAALLICWVGGAVIERVYDTYTRQARQTEIARQIQRLAALRSGNLPGATPVASATTSESTTAE